MKRDLRAAFLILNFGGDFAKAQTICHQAHRISKDQLIANSIYGEFLVPHENGFMGFYLDGEIFHSKHFSNWDEVRSFYNALPPHDRTLLSSRISASKVSLPDYVARLLKLAQAEGGELSYGIKDMNSLKHKILDRIELNRKNNEDFTLDDLNDIARARITLPISSHLLKLTTKEDWAHVLGVSESMILSVDVKGGPRSIQKNNYYTAVHVALQGAGRQTFELQIMSKAMAIWHKWDHQHVYKSQAAQSGKNNFKLYSIDWAKIIHSLSGQPSSSQRRRTLESIAGNYGLPPFSDALELVVNLDQAIKKELRMKAEDGFSQSELYDLANSFQ